MLDSANARIVQQPVHIETGSRAVRLQGVDGKVQAELAALEELYQAAKAQRFRGEPMEKLEAEAKAFVEARADAVPAATLATAQTYVLRCRLSTDEAYDEVFLEATALLDDGKHKDAAAKLKDALAKAESALP